MIWFWAFLIFFFFIVLMATSFGFSYVRTVKMIGREATHRNLRHTLPNMLFVFAIALVTPFLGKYGLASLCIIGSIGFSLWLLTWFFRKKESGNLLINIGRTSINRFVFRISVLYVLIAILMTWGLFVQISAEVPQNTDLGFEIYNVVFNWVFAIYLLAAGLSHLEFRENGICFMFSFFNWQRINSYKWEPSKPNTLTIWFKPRFPLVPGFLSLPIPAKYRDVVNQILDDRLPGKNL